MSIDLAGLTVTALVNGINPCGIGMMITFLGYLLVFGGYGGTKKQMKGAGGFLTLGLVYIFSVFVSYLMIGLIFYGVAFYLQRLWIAVVFKYLMGGGVFLAGLIQLKDFFWPDAPIHLRMPGFGSKKIGELMQKMSLPMAFVIGVATTAFSTPCMLPLYVGTATMLAGSGLPIWLILTYFIYYNLIFIGPLILILLVMYKSQDVVKMKEMEHKYGKWIRLVMGLLMVVVGYKIVFS